MVPDGSMHRLLAQLLLGFENEIREDLCNFPVIFMEKLFTFGSQITRPNHPYYAGFEAVKKIADSEKIPQKKIFRIW